MPRLRDVIAAKEEQTGSLTAGLEAALAALRGEQEQRRRLELRVAELERRLPIDSSYPGTPSSKDWIGAEEARKARQQPERERGKDCRRGGQPGHPPALQLSPQQVDLTARILQRVIARRAAGPLPGGRSWEMLARTGKCRSWRYCTG